jgi:hypothetical protein
VTACEIEHAIHHAQQRIDVVRDEQHRHAALAPEARDQRDDFVRAAKIKIC